MRMGLVVGGLLGATAGAALAAYVQKRRASEPRDENEFRGELVTGDIETIPALSLFLKLGPAFYLAVKIGFPGLDVGS